MEATQRPVRILMVDDDEDDCLLFRDALTESRVLNHLQFCHDGEELMEVLASTANADLPDLVLLDLNMPRKDGRAALGEMRADGRLKHIPVVVLTTSKAEEDIFRSYDLGANSYIQKPVGFESLVGIVRVLNMYWFQMVQLPRLEEK